MSSKIECTAVNELIDLVQHRPLRRDSHEELMFQPPREVNLRRTATGTQAPLISYRKQVFEPTPRPRVEEDLETTYVPRQLLSGDVPTLLKKLALPAGMLLMIGIGVGAAVSMTRHKPADAAPAVAAVVTTPPAVTVVAAAPVIKPAPKLLTVRLESTPPGATATLLDTTTGNTMPLGTTPVEASVDPAKAYDVRFELDGRPSQTEHLDPAQPRIDVTLAEPIQVVAPAPVVADKKYHHHHASTHVAAKRVATATSARSINKTKLATPDFSPSKSSKQDALAALGPAPDKKGDKRGSDVPGKVAVSASVPCAILLDGANTGMTSPATLSVAAGHHSIRLIAATQHINKQFAVDVTAKKTTRLDQTF